MHDGSRPTRRCGSRRAAPARSRSAPSDCAWELDEIEQLRLAEGEWEELSAEQKRLSHAKDLIEGADAASMALSKGDEAITETLATLQHRLQGLSTIDASLAPVAELIDSAAIQLAEAGSELAAYVQRMDLDPERLAEVESRVERGVLDGAQAQAAAGAAVRTPGATAYRVCPTGRCPGSRSARGGCSARPRRPTANARRC